MKGDWIDREEAWLRFNERVLAQAEDLTVPLLEKLQFCSIYNSNSDEYYGTRVARLLRNHKIALCGKNKEDKEKIRKLNAIVARTVEGNIRRDRDVRRILRNLADNDIFFAEYRQRPVAERIRQAELFDKTVKPYCSVLTWQADIYPQLLSNAVYAAVAVQNKTESELLLVSCTAKATVMTENTETADGTVREILRVYTAEELLLHHIRRLFPKKRVLAAMLFRLTKDSELPSIMEIAADNDGYPEAVHSLIAQRAFGNSIKLEYVAGQTAEKLAFPEKLCEIFEVSPKTCFECRSFLSYDWLSELRHAVADKLPALSYPPAEPIDADDSSLLPESLTEQAVCLHYPYHSVGHYLRFLRHAVEDERTRKIQMTVYRLAPQSQIAGLLKEAANRGIDVRIVVELRARFDEVANDSVAAELKKAGCHVTYGYGKCKVHAKLTLVTYLSDGTVMRYAHIGTGNYNEKTAKLYTDLNLFTADKTICNDVAALFDGLESGKLGKNETSLLIAPVSLRDRLNRQIEAETKKGKSGYILMKMNSLTDRIMAMKLIKAADAGVKIDLIVRGVCCLNPAMSKHPKNIRVISIVGRLLEHLRVYSFGNTADNRRMFFGSADIMSRNIDKRVEVLVPVFDTAIRNRLYEMLCCQLNDTAKAYVLKQNGEYRKVSEKKESDSVLLDSQMELFRFYAKR